MNAVDYFKARLTPDGKERFDELAGKYEHDAGMSKEDAEEKAYRDMLDECR